MKSLIVFGAVLACLGTLPTKNEDGRFFAEAIACLRHDQLQEFKQRWTGWNTREALDDLNRTVPGNVCRHALWWMTTKTTDRQGKPLPSYLFFKGNGMWEEMEVMLVGKTTVGNGEQVETQQHRYALVFLEFMLPI